MYSQYLRDWRVWAAIAAVLIIFGMSNRSHRETAPAYYRPQSAPPVYGTPQGMQGQPQSMQLQPQPLQQPQATQQPREPLTNQRPAYPQIAPGATTPGNAYP